jgi:hypothetical protein
VIEAFYASVYPSLEELTKNRSNVAIEIMNLISNFNSTTTRQAILLQFCESGKVPIEDVLAMSDLFAVLGDESYSQNGEEIELKKRELVSWLLIIDSFINHIRKNLARLEGATLERLQRERQKWSALGEEYNTHLLSNIKPIIHEKMRGELTPYFLKLMGKLILPVGSAFEGYLDHMYERIVGIF